jgi:hypothetical protein
MNRSRLQKNPVLSKDTCSLVHWVYSICTTLYIYVLVHCNKNPFYVFLFWELRGLSPNFYMSVSDLYIPTINLHVLLQENMYVDRSWEYINRSQTHECGNWVCGCEIPFLGIIVSNFRYCVFAVYGSTSLLYLSFTIHINMLFSDKKRVVFSILIGKSVVEKYAPLLP